MAEYKVVITPSAKRVAKKLPAYVRQEAVSQSFVLRNNPHHGEKLTGPLRFLYSLHFKIKNVQYRIAYAIDTKQKFIVVHLIGPRENFYKKLRNLFK